MEVIFTVAYTEALRRRYIGLGAQIKGKQMKNNSHLIISSTQIRLHVSHTLMLNTQKCWIKDLLYAWFFNSSRLNISHNVLFVQTNPIFP